MAVERAPEVERLLAEARCAFRAGDLAALERLIADDPAVLMLGSDPDDVVEGREAALEALGRELDARAAGESEVTVEHTEVRAWREGRVAWAIETMLYRFPDGATLPARRLAVLHREATEWKLLQSSFSFALPNVLLERGPAFADVFAATSA